MRKYVRILFYFGIVLLFVLIAIAGFTQTRAFRNSLQSFIFANYSAVLDGDLRLASIEGNLVTGLQLNQVGISRNGVDIFEAERIEVRYDPLGFFLNRVPLSRVIITRPRVNIVRSSNGAWCFDGLFKTSAIDTTPSQWKIDIKRMELVRAELYFADSVQLADRRSADVDSIPPNAVDYSQFSLDSLNLVMSLQIAGGKYFLRIADLGFRSLDPVFTLKHLQGDFSLTKDEVKVQNARIETARSSLTFDAGLRNTDITKLVDVRDLEKKPLTLNLQIQNLDTDELKQFVHPWVDFLEKSFAAEVKVSGTLGRLSVNHIMVKTQRSSIQAQGFLSNLHRPSDLYLDLELNFNKIHPLDLAEYLPGLKLPDLTSLGEVNYFLTYQGRLGDFHAHFIGESEAGTLDLDTKVKIEHGVLSYEGTALTGNIDLGKILEDSALVSSVNSRITFNAVGTNVHTMSGVVKMEIDSSRFHGLTVRQSIVVADLADRLAHARISANIGSTMLNLSGKMQFHPYDSTTYEIGGNVTSLDLSEVLRDRNFASDLSFTVFARGQSGRPGNRFDSLSVDFVHSTFADKKFDEGKMRILATRQDSLQSAFHLRSDAADVDVEGQFTMKSLIGTFRSGGEILGHAIANRFRNLDSLRAFRNEIRIVQPTHPVVSVEFDPVDTRIIVDVKNAYPIGVVLHQKLAGTCKMRGELVGTLDDLLFSGTMQMDQLEYESSSNTYGLQDGELNFYLSGIAQSDIFESLSASVDLKASAFIVNSTVLWQPAASLMSEGDSTDFQVSALIDSVVQVDVEGKSRFRSRLLELELTQLKLEIGTYAFENTEPLTIDVGQDWFYLRDFFIHHDAEEIVSTGYFNPEGVSDLKIGVRGFLVNNVQNILGKTKYASLVADIGGVLNSDLTFRGSFDHPNLSLTVSVDGVRARETVFGRVESKMSYFEHMLNVFVQYRSKPEDTLSTPDLLLSGTLPYEFTIAEEAKHPLEGEINLLLQSKGLRMEYLDPFVPEVANLIGMLTCDMKMHGPIDNPQYEGTMAIQGAKFLFRPLGIQYTLDGTFVPRGNRIELQNVTIRNVPQDRTDGLMKVSGSFTLVGLQFTDFNFLANGQLLVMKESARKAGQKLYGNLFAATGPDGIFWSGTVLSSNVRGKMYIKSAQLILPPEREVVVVGNRTISVTYLDDTSRVRAPSLNERSPARLASGLFVQNTPGGMVDAGNAEGATPQRPPEAPTSFLDGINYDIRIETQGPTQLQFIFNTQTQEQLFADLQGSLSFFKTPSMTRLTGEVQVGDRSYYTFFKKFQATGKLLFTGDALNPELNIVARYEGLHRKDTSATKMPLGYNPDVTKVDEKVAVILEITGTRKEPKPKMTIERDGQTWNSGDVESDAISFILSGQFRDELTDQQRRSFIGTNLGYGLASGMLTGPLTEMLRRQTGVIQSVDVLYYGGNKSFGESADVRLTGQVGEAVIRLGGRVLNDLGNTNASVELPMSSVVGSEQLRNLILTLERRVEGTEAIEDRRTASNGARLFYRITF
ncbi:MAG: hypothetical protein WBD36_05205 [Bacteroidota bacterium]